MSEPAGGPFYGEVQARIHDERYGDLARAYARLLASELRGAGLHDGTVVDLGCGSGILAEALGAVGYDVIGVDVSPAMAALARHRAPRATITVGSAWDVEFPPAVAIAATGEVLGYRTDERAEPDGLRALIGRAAHALLPGGVLALDLAAPGRGGPTGEREQLVDTDGWTMHFRATEDAGARLLRRRMIIFWRDGDAYRRVDELHELRLHEPETVERFMAEAGLTPSRLDLPGPPDGWFALMGRKPAA